MRDWDITTRPGPAVDSPWFLAIGMAGVVIAAEDHHRHR